MIGTKWGGPPLNICKGVRKSHRAIQKNAKASQSCASKNGKKTLEMVDNPVGIRGMQIE